MGRLLLLFQASFLLSVAYLAGANDFYVGGRNGWVLKPAESYNLWSSRRRFLVNDRLVFKYKKGEGSVLVVKKEDYDSCNVNNPIKKFDDGNTVFTLDKAGPFFFIDGEPGHCAQGQKLVLVVLSIRNKKPSPSAASPSPLASAVSPLPASPLPAPEANPPTSSPSGSPSSFVSPPSPSPSGSEGPSTSSPSSSLVPSPANSPFPAETPFSSPVPSPPEAGISAGAPGASGLPPKAFLSPSPSISTTTSSPSTAKGIVVSTSFLGMLALLFCDALL